MIHSLSVHGLYPIRPLIDACLMPMFAQGNVPICSVRLVRAGVRTHIRTHVFQRNMGGLSLCVRTYIPEATEPIVWQARVLQNIPPQRLILVPWSEDLHEVTEAKQADKAKRPKSLHPYLPAMAMCEVKYGGATGDKGDKGGKADQGDNVQFVMRSPLASKLGGLSPSPFWSVLASTKKDKINMGIFECALTMPRLTASVVGVAPDKKKKPMPVTIAFPVLVNKEPLEKDTVLVMNAADIDKVDHRTS